MRGKGMGKNIRLSIPNMEIRNIFTEQIMTMFREETKKDGERLEKFCDALKTGDGEEVERLFNAYLGKTISIRDTFVRRPMKENFYHGILLGILGFKSGWYVRSNEESGDGYSDILVKIENEDVGIIIEVKYADHGSFDSACKEALEQIAAQEYGAGFKEDGEYTIFKYGIGCFKKKCKVIVKKEMASGLRERQ